MIVLPELVIIREYRDIDSDKLHRLPGVLIVVKKVLSAHGLLNFTLYDETPGKLFGLVPEVIIIISFSIKAQQQQLEQRCQALDSPSLRSSLSGKR